MNIIEKIKGANLQQVRLFVFALFALVLPFSGFHLTPEIFEYDTSLFVSMYALIAITLWCVQMIRRKEITFYWNIIDTTVLVGLLILGVMQYVTHATPLSIMPSIALSATSFWMLVMYGVIYFTSKDVVRDLKLITIARALHVVTAISVVLAILGLFFQAMPRFYVTSVASLIIFSILSIVSAVYLITISSSYREKVLYGVWITVLLVAIILSQAYFAVILTLVIGGISALLIASLHTTKASQRLVLGITGVLVILTGALYIPFGSLVGIPQVMDQVLPPFAGLEITKATLDNNLLFGLGLQDFSQGLYQYKPVLLGQTVFAFTHFTRSSALIFELLTTGGIVTTLIWYSPLILFMFLLGQHVYRLRNGENESLKPHYLFAFTVSAVFVLGSLVYMFDVILFAYAMIFLAVAYPLLLKSVIVTKPISQVITSGLSYVGIILFLVVFVVGGGRVKAYEQYLTAIQEGAPLSEKVYSQLSHDPYVGLTYSAHQVQSVNHEISQEEKEMNVRSGIEALQKIFVTYPKNFMILSSVEQLNTMYQQIVGEYPINNEELKLLITKTYPKNPSTRYQKAFTQLQSQNIVSTEGEPQKDVVVAKETIQESISLLIALTEEYTTLQQAHLLLAYALTASGDITGAEQSYLRALVIDPVNKAAVIGLAQNLITQERKEEARKLLETYQKDNEDDVEIKTLLEKL